MPIVALRASGKAEFSRGVLQREFSHSLGHKETCTHYLGTAALIQFPDIISWMRLRTTDETIYLRNGSVNRINGIIGMTFSCDGAHYIDHKEFFDRLETLATTGCDDTPPATARG